MRLIGREKLAMAQGKDVQLWIRSWAAEVTEAQWRQPEDVKEQFPKARHGGEGVFEFPIDQSQWVIQLRIAFTQKIALVSGLQTNKVIYGS